MNGILLLYNGANSLGKDGDPKITPGAGTMGMALFNLHSPADLVSRTDRPFLLPAAAVEGGSNGTVTGGALLFNGQWDLVYGCGLTSTCTARYTPADWQNSPLPSTAASPASFPSPSSISFSTREQAVLRKQIRIGLAVTSIIVFLVIFGLYVLRRGDVRRMTLITLRDDKEKQAQEEYRKMETL